MNGPEGLVKVVRAEGSGGDTLAKGGHVWQNPIAKLIGYLGRLYRVGQFMKGRPELLAATLGC